MLSSQTLLIVIISAGIVALVVATFLLRYLVLSCRGKPSAPIPPPQPLARQRAQAAESRPSTMYTISRLHVPETSFTSSLSPAQAYPSTPSTPTVANSFEDTTVESGTSDLTLNKPLDGFTSPPPAFRLNSPSSPSLPPSDNDSPSTSPIDLPLHNPSPPRARSHSRPRSSISSRPQSFSSLNSRHTMRAMPHGPYSSVQVVMPEPLAPGGSLPSRPSVNNRLSIVDTWTAPLSRTESPREASDSRRCSTSSLGSASAHRQRRFSVSSSPSTSPQGVADPGMTPPVPRIPSIYNTTSSSR